MTDNNVHAKDGFCQDESKEVGLVAKPIEATPVLKGKDLADLVKDIKRPDLGKERRKRALQILKNTSKG